MVIRKGHKVWDDPYVLYTILCYAAYAACFPLPRSSALSKLYSKLTPPHPQQHINNAYNGRLPVRSYSTSSRSRSQSAQFLVNGWGLERSLKNSNAVVLYEVLSNTIRFYILTSHRHTSTSQSIPSRDQLPIYIDSIQSSPTPMSIPNSTLASFLNVKHQTGTNTILDEAIHSISSIDRLDP